MRDVFSPLFLTALFFLFVGHGLGVPSPVLLPILWIFAAVSLSCFSLRLYRASYFFFVVTFSLLLLFVFCREKERFADLGETAFPPDDYVTIQGTLADYPEIKADGSVLLIRARRFSCGAKHWSLAMNVRLKVKGSSVNLNRGDEVTADALLFASSLRQNFFRNGYGDYLLSRGIHVQGFCKSAELIQRVKKSGPLWRIIGHWRHSLRSLIEKRYRRSGKLSREGVYLEATLLGDRGQLDDRIEEELIRSGVLHLIAISGANIGIIALFCLSLGRLFRLHLRLRYGLTAMVLLLFLAISGFDVSAQRAVLMALLLFCARLFFQEYEITNVIAFSGVLMLAWRPVQFLDPGFVLTYALTYSLAFGRQIFVPPSPGWRRWLSGLLGVNCSAAVFSLPLSLYYFQRCSLAGMFSGIILVPLTALITAAGLLLIPLSVCLTFAAKVVLAFTDPLLRLFFAVTSWIAGLNLEIYRPPPSLLLVLVLFLFFAVLSRPKVRPAARRVFLALLAALVLLPLLDGRVHRPDRLEVYFLDVGQGDCEVVVFPGGTGLLVDGGGGFLSDFKVGKRLVLPFLLQKRIHVDWLAISHFHPDHVSGILELLPFLKPKEIWISAAPVDDPCYRQLVGSLPESCRLVQVVRGFQRTVAGCTVEALFPGVFPDTDRARNNDSMVLKVVDDRHSFLLAGDIEMEAETRLVSDASPNLPADVLKIAHHGSGKSSSLPFLRQVRPRLAVISYGPANSFGFPHPRVRANLKKLGIPWLSTARRGGICVASTATGLRLEVSK